MICNAYDFDCFVVALVKTEQTIPPSFTKPMSEIQEILGTFVQIGCKISGSLPITVEWQKDGNNISVGGKYKLVRQDNSVSLEIEQLERVDAGTYSCKLTNKAGSVECSGAVKVKGQN